MMGHRFMLSSYLFAAVLGLVSPSDEPQVRADVPSFGQRGQLVLRGATNANVMGNHQRAKVGDVTYTGNSINFSVEPSAGVFVIDNLLVGGLFNVGYAYQSSVYTLNANVGPYIGYRVPMGATTSFLPTLAGFYNFSRSHVNAQDASGALTKVDIDSQSITLRVTADFVFHVAPRVSLTAGPFVSQSVYSHGQNGSHPMVTSYGLRAGVLAWL
jgi:hypothetical protein